MYSGALELRGDGRDIALRNEELNRKRLESRGSPGGPLKITDPAAFARTMAEMRAKAEEQRAAEAQREAERARREGANYKSKEERERAAREAKQQPQGEDEARQLERRFDPSKNYYEILGVDRCAATAEIKRAYKKLALAYHPDKHKAQDAEQQAAIADKFREVAEAFDVLSDEAQRAVYDKVRDYKEANPGRGLPVLSPEEMAMMRSGAAELRRLRRMGTKLTKHKPLEREVWVSLKKLNGGGMKRVTVERQRVDADGSLIQHSRTFHLVIRKGMQEGDRLTFEGEGEEAVDTQPGDLLFLLRQKPHPLFKRSGRANLEVFARALAPGDVLVGVDLTTLQGKRLLLRGSAFAAAAASGCGGGMWRSVVAGQGLWDPQDPWDNPPGDLVVQVRYPGYQLGRANVRSCLQPRPLHLLGSAAAAAPAAMVGGCLVAALRHRQLAQELEEEEREEEAWQGGGRSDGLAAEATGSGLSSTAASPPRRPLLAVCLSIPPPGSAATGESGEWGPSPAAQALLRVLQRRVAGLRTQCIALHLGQSAPGSRTAATQILSPGSLLLDDEWCALHEAEVIILDCPATAAAGEEGVLSWLTATAEGAGVAEVLLGAFLHGASLVGIGGACALLGRQPQQGMPSTGAPGTPPPGPAPAILPWYMLRAGGGEAGWAGLHAALQRAAGQGGKTGGQTPAVVGVGVLAGSAYVVDPCTGTAELLVAPPRETLVATARWAAAQEEGPAGVEEADDDYGYSYAAASCC